MKVRALEESDIPILQAMAENMEFPYPDLKAANLEAVMVIVDDDGPVMAAAAERLVELTLWCSPGGDPHRKLHALRLVHEAMEKELRAKGYTRADAFISPALARFGRRLEKTFGWRRNWPSWTTRGSSNG